MTLGDGRRRIPVDGVHLDPVTEAGVVEAVCGALERGEGGRIVTPNVDILRFARADPAVRAHLADATLVVADGMPLVWASRLAGTPLPERVPGSSLIWSLSYHLGRAGRSVYLLGGQPAPDPGATVPPDPGATVPAGPGVTAPAGTAATVPATPGASAGSRRAGAVLAAACPGLRVAGVASPPYGFETDPAAWAAVCAGVIEAKPDLVLVGLGFPKQERVIDALRPDLPMSWFLGCGAAIDFVAGDQVRAPGWMQRAGLEWAWRLAGDPRRLAGRYLRRGAPYAVRLLMSSAVRRPLPAMPGGSGARRRGR